MKSYDCNICNKKYASYKSLWNHRKKFHSNTDLVNENNIDINNIDINNIDINNIDKNNVNNNILNKNNVNNNSLNKNNVNNNSLNKSNENKDIQPKFIQKSSFQNLQCIYCEKFYKTPSSKCTHMKSCKKKHPEIQIINNKNICDICNKTFVFSTSVYKHKKICDNKQEKLNNNIINNITNNNNNNNNNSNNNNITNNIINNNITNNNITNNNKYIVNFSDNTDCFRLLSTPQKLQILQHCRRSFEKMIKLTNFNDDYPELQNIYFGDKKSTATGYVFEDSKFIAINKLEVLNDTYNDKISLMSEIIDDESIGSHYDRRNYKFKI